MALKFGEPMPWEAMRWIIAGEMGGWTLEYIDMLDIRDVSHWQETRRGQALANKGRK